MTEPVNAAEEEPFSLHARSRALGALWVGIRGPLPGLLLLVATLVVSLFALLVLPPISAPSRSDVVFVIGPSDGWRVAWAEQLVDEGLAGEIMISVSDPEAVSVCAAGQYDGVTVLCQRPDPFTTQGEARLLKAAMTAHGWATATVITVTPHVARTRVYFDRCIDTGVTVVGRSTGMNNLGDWAHQIEYQLGAFLKAFLVTTTC